LQAASFAEANYSIDFSYRRIGFHNEQQVIFSTNEIDGL